MAHNNLSHLYTAAWHIQTIHNKHPEWNPQQLDGAVHSLHANCDLVGVLDSLAPV
jgi:hypothetical protein